MKKSSPLPVPKHYLRRHTAATISPPNTLRPKVSETALGKSNANGGGGSMVDLQQSTHMPESVRTEPFYPIAGVDSAQLGAKKSTDNLASGVPAIVIDDERTRSEIEQLQRKRASIVKKLKEEQAVKEENVNEYLAMTSSLTAANETRAQQQHIKTLFGRREQRSAQVIAQLQQKLDKYDERLRALHAQSRRHTLDTVNSSSKIKDAATSSKVPAEQQMSVSVTDGPASATSGTVGNGVEERRQLVAPGLTVKAPSEDGMSSVGSVGGVSVGTGSGVMSSPYSRAPHSTTGALSDQQQYASSLDGGRPTLSDELKQRLAKQQATLESFLLNFEEYRKEQHAELEKMRVTLEADRLKLEMLQVHLLEIGDMRHNDNVNIRQNMADMEEHMEYRLEEHMRDLHELLERCQTRVLKLELSHQQQQQTIMEGFDSSSMRNLLAKVLNVVLAIIAVFVVLLSSLVTILQPCFSSRASVMLSLTVVVVAMIAWYDWRSAGLWQRLLGRSTAVNTTTTSSTT